MSKSYEFIHEIHSVFKLKNQKLLLLSKPVQAWAIYQDKRINLLTQKEEKRGRSFLEAKLQKLKVSKQARSWHVFHLAYEFGLEKPKTSDLLGFYFEYQESECLSKSQKTTPVKMGKLKNPLSFSSYQEGFKKIQEHLKLGNCYQVNFTYPFEFGYESSPQNSMEHFFSLKNLSAYAHGSWIPQMEKLLLSNSPECLFSLKEDKIYSMPIKGSYPLKDTKPQKAWQILKKSQKDQNELYMITDLLRNDLARIDHPSAKIILKKRPLFVPGLVHQYSVIEQKLTPKINLKQIIYSMFPGGSITGAPKKRVMEIISNLEKNPRGFYCGSTILWHREIKRASINIRTAQIDTSKKTLTYGSGGGITLRSKARNEFEEMEWKLKSFMDLFGE